MSLTLDSLLDAVDVRIRRQRRVELDTGRMLGLDGLTIVYVLSGSAAASGKRLATGDVLLSSGQQATTLTAEDAASVLVSELELSDRALLPLPDVATITAFDVLEPAAAALAQNMATDKDAVCTRSGDIAICRLMAKTVLASVIRAWTANGCAPDGWPAAASDPFLDRVIEAIHAEPGRDWTVEALASVGAMSRSVFAERFRSAYGQSPAGYVATVRMQAAQGLLSRGLGVSAVSRELGYASDEGFSRAFRRHVGTTPSAWRASRQLVSA